MHFRCATETSDADDGMAEHRLYGQRTQKILVCPLDFRKRSDSRPLSGTADGGFTLLADARNDCVGMLQTALSTGRFQKKIAVCLQLPRLFLRKGDMVLSVLRSRVLMRHSASIK
jgi:hypothetical protein